jgi:outer membrane protein assembly factor BamA
LEAKVSYRVEKEENRYRIFIEVQEGPRYKLKAVRARGKYLLFVQGADRQSS